MSWEGSPCPCRIRRDGSPGPGWKGAKLLRHNDLPLSIGWRGVSGQGDVTSAGCPGSIGQLPLIVTEQEIGCRSGRDSCLTAIHGSGIFGRPGNRREIFRKHINRWTHETMDRVRVTSDRRTPPQGIALASTGIARISGAAQSGLHAVAAVLRRSRDGETKPPGFVGPIEGAATSVTRLRRMVQ